MPKKSHTVVVLFVHQLQLQLGRKDCVELVCEPGRVDCFAAHLARHAVHGTIDADNLISRDARELQTYKDKNMNFRHKSDFNDKLSRYGNIYVCCTTRTRSVYSSMHTLAPTKLYTYL